MRRQSQLEILIECQLVLQRSAKTTQGSLIPRRRLLHNGELSQCSLVYLFLSALSAVSFIARTFPSCKGEVAQEMILDWRIIIAAVVLDSHDSPSGVRAGKAF